MLQQIAFLSSIIISVVSYYDRAPIPLEDHAVDLCHPHTHWEELPISVFPDSDLSISYEILFKDIDFQLTEEITVADDVCQKLCLERKVEDQQCRFYTPIFNFREELFACYLMGHTNNWELNTAWGFVWFSKPRYCLPNDGCLHVGEYMADTNNRCIFHQCATSTDTNQTLRAKGFRCPIATMTRTTFLSSRNDGAFTQPCSVRGFYCRRSFPLFSP